MFSLIFWNFFRSPDQSFCFRRSPKRCSIKRGVLKNVAKLTGKFLRQSLFFSKVAGLKPATLIKKRLWHRCLPVNFAKFLRTPFFTEHLWWLLLSVNWWLYQNFADFEMAVRDLQNTKPIFKTTKVNLFINKKFQKFQSVWQVKICKSY